MRTPSDSQSHHNQKPHPATSRWWPQLGEAASVQSSKVKLATTASSRCCLGRASGEKRHHISTTQMCLPWFCVYLDNIFQLSTNHPSFFNLTHAWRVRRNLMYYRSWWLLTIRLPASAPLTFWETNNWLFLGVTWFSCSSCVPRTRPDGWWFTHTSRIYQLRDPPNSRQCGNLTIRLHGYSLSRSKLMRGVYE